MTMTGAPVVLTEKLRKPEPAGLSRRRLEDRLLNDTRSRLHLVVAPPGSGKTTLLAAVAAATSSPVAWYRVTADDAAEPALVAHLGRALDEALQIGHAAATMSDLLEALEAWPGASAVLILDDLHEVAGSRAERALEQFIELRPHGLRVLVGSRRQPEINIPRLRVSGLLQEISSEDLRFRSWEVEELFQAVFHEPLSPESAAALTRRTGGWAAGLQLFHLATAGRSAVDRQRAVDDLGGRSKLVRSYLARNVLAELPEDRRQFLLRTCTLGSLTGELCDALLETTGSRKVLDELEQQQLFTSSEDDGETFRYHQVLRTHLEWALVQEYGAAGARQWYSRSGALLESIGDDRGAVHAHARAEDWGAVARLLQVRGGSGGDPAAGADLLLPASVVEHDPWLSLAEARRRVREGSLAAAVDAFRRAENLLDEPDFRDICRRERAVAALWGKGRGGSPSWDREADHWSVQLRAATSHAPRVVAAPGRALPRQMGRRPPLTGADRLGQGLTALVIGDFTAAAELLRSVHDEPAADTVHRLIAQLAVAVLDIVTSSGDDPSGQLGRIALDAELAGLPWVARLARGLEDAALLALGSAPWRMRSCLDLLAECDRTGDDWGAALLRLATAIGGRIAGADVGESEFADAARRFRNLDAPVLVSWAEALQAVAVVASGSTRGPIFAAEVARQAQAVRLSGPAALALAAGASGNPESAGAGPAGLAGSVPSAPSVTAEHGVRPHPAADSTGTAADMQTIRRIAQAMLAVRDTQSGDRADVTANRTVTTAPPSSSSSAAHPDRGMAEAETLSPEKGHVHSGPVDGGPSKHMPNDAAPNDAAPGDAAPGDAALGDAALGDAEPGDAEPGDADLRHWAMRRWAMPHPAMRCRQTCTPSAGTPTAVTPSAGTPADGDLHTPVLRITCFGSFEIEVDGRPVNLAVLRPRARALLRLLCLSPHRDVHREYLVDALWPGTDLAVGTRRLQVAMSSVRQVLEHAGLRGSDVLARQGDAYRLAPPPGSVIDVQAFEVALQEGNAAAARGDADQAMTCRAAALTHYRGDALPEDGPAEYVVAERERLRLAAAAAAAALAQDCRTLGHPRQALAAARRSVQLDPYQDLGWRLLIQLHEESGDNSAAALARRDHARVQAELELVTG